jgi:hypothetical protein
MKNILAKYHPEKRQELRKCIIEEMQSQDEAKNFDPETLSDERKLAEEMEDILDKYEKICTTSRNLRIEVISVIIGGIIFIAIVIIVAVCNNKAQSPNEPEIIVETVV